MPRWPMGDPLLVLQGAGSTPFPSSVQGPQALACGARPSGATLSFMPLISVFGAKTMGCSGQAWRMLLAAGTGVAAPKATPAASLHPEQLRSSSDPVPIPAVMHGHRPPFPHC